MSATNSRLSSAIAAFLLSALTLGTFYFLREYGPERAVQHFHAAALAGDLNDLQRYTLQSVSDPSVAQLVARVRNIAARGGYPQVSTAQRHPDRVVVLIEYLMPGGGSDDIYWVVDQTRAYRWVVNAELTTAQRAGY